MAKLSRQSNTLWIKLLGIFLSAVLLVPSAYSVNLEEQREAFLHAVKLAGQGNTEALTYKSGLLQDYVLRSDIKAIYLKNSLKRQPNRVISEFLQQYPDQATSNDLLRSWLSYLYKTKQWETYLANAPVPNPSKSSTARRCEYLEAQIKTRQAVDLAQDALPIWMVGKSQPKACDPLFEVLKNRGLLTEDRIHSRIDLSLQKAKFGLATHLQTFLPSKERKAVSSKTGLWRKMSASPSRYLKDAKSWRDGKVSRAIVGYGIRKQARLDINKALEIWPGLKKRFSFTKSELDAVENYLALRAAYQRHPQTRQVFAATDKTSLSLREREWQVRNALWEHDWNVVLDAIGHMPAASQQKSQWRYWQARALEEQGNTSLANSIFQELASGHGYFEFLAADRLEQSYQFKHSPLNPNEPVLAQLAARTDLRRARELVKVNMLGRSRSEWRSALNRMSLEEKNQAGLLAMRWDLPTSTIQTAVNSQAREDIDLLYPRSYEDHVLKTAKRFSLDPAWVFGVIRQESLFMPDVRSSANAYGLMQLLPATAKQTARKNKIRYNGYSHLINPNRNIELGSAYLSEVNRRLQSNPALASAAYNGGPHRVRKWLPKRDMAADIWVENIVFNETRNYVQKVLTNKVIYSWRMQGEPIRLKNIMKVVKPRESARTAQTSTKKMPKTAGI